MKKQTFFLNIIVVCLLLPICLTGCSAWFNKKTPPNPITKIYTLAHFNNLTITGPTNVIIIPDKHRQKLAIIGAAENIGKVTVYQNANKLIINVPQTIPYSTTIYLTTGFLQKLNLSNGVFLKAKKLETLNLNLNSHDSYDMHLSGQFIAAKTQIEQQGSGKINIIWLASDKVNLHSGHNGLVELAGEIFRLSANLSGSAYLDAQALRTNQVFINTNKSAIAHIEPLDYLSAHTRDSSNVLYYNRPSELYIDSEDSSNALMVKP